MCSQCDTRRSEKQILSMNLAARREEKKYQKEVETCKIRETYMSMAKKERMNKDIALELLREQLKMKSDLTRKILSDVSAASRDLCHRVLYDGELRKTLASTLFLSAFTLLSLRTGVRVAGDALAVRLGTPKLIRETSIGFSPLKWMTRRKNTVPIHSLLKTTPEMQALMEQILQSTQSSNRLFASSKSFLFQGPPGTGKTTLAR